MKKSLGIITCFLLAGCDTSIKKVIKGPSPGIEYHNQTTAPWPWVSIVPSERALALKAVNFDSISKHMLFDMSFEPHQETFKDVRVILVDYTIIPEETPGIKPQPSKPEITRSKSYVMVASFYKIGKRPPCPPDFEITTTLQANRAPPQEGLRYMSRDTIEEAYVLHTDGLLTPGLKITVDLD